MKWTFLFLLFAMLAKGGDEFSAEKKPGELSDSLPQRPISDHLFTFEDSSSDGILEAYEKRMQSHLVVTDGALARMITLPSFSDERCLSIYLKDEQGKQKFFITVTKAEKNLWYSMEGNNEDHKTQEVKIKRVDREISQDLANEIHGIWSAVLLKNKPDSNDDGLDGVTIRFSAVVKDRGLLQGETWSPEKGLPAKMVETGDAIIEFAEDKDAHEEPLMKRLKEFETSIPKS